jgi:type II secretion system protein G
MFAKIAAKRRGFTLIELLVVIVIIAVLALIAIPKFQDAGKRSKEASLRSDLTLLRTAVGTYETDTGAYPTQLSDLAATTAPANGVSSAGTPASITATDWHGPYLQSLPTDPIANAAFSYTGTGSSGIGTVKSSSTATALDGTVYNTW